MPNETTFAIGARVRLRADSADYWADPKLRLRARKGVTATVLHVLGARLPPLQRSYAVVFESVGQLNPRCQVVPVRELEAVDV